MQINDSFLTPHEYPCMITRLLDEIREGWRQFRENPGAFFESDVLNASGNQHRKNLLKLGLAIGLLFYTVGFVAILILWTINRPRTIPVERTSFFVPPKLYNPPAKMPADDPESGGGGGGGRSTTEPPSKGDLPPFQYENLIVAPRPENTLRPPSLPVVEMVKVDPRILVERDNLSFTGLPDGASIPPSAGPGSDSGIGTGSHGGIGPGDGDGLGPGKDGNTGGKLDQIGGRRNSGGPQERVDSRPILLNHPQPFFTELARKNKVQGVVRVRILVDANGAVKEVGVVRGLPDGLNEQAIRAAYQMRFRPAMKDGRAVSYWMNNVEVEFNLR